jgi:hypothetical protein
VNKWFTYAHEGIPITHMWILQANITVRSGPCSTLAFNMAHYEPL